MAPKFKDISDEDEDERIRQIGEAALLGTKVGFIVDDEPGKPERYISKLKKRFPNIIVTHQGPGPVPETILVKVTSNKFFN